MPRQPFPHRQLLRADGDAGLLLIGLLLLLGKLLRLPGLLSLLLLLLLLISLLRLLRLLLRGLALRLAALRSRQRHVGGELRGTCPRLMGSPSLQLGTNARRLHLCEQAAGGGGRPLVHAATRVLRRCLRIAVAAVALPLLHLVPLLLLQQGAAVLAGAPLVAMERRRQQQQRGGAGGQLQGSLQAAGAAPPPLAGCTAAGGAVQVSAG